MYMGGDWRERLFATTRGRVVQLLRRSAQTVNDLAAKLDLTDNAVRLHLSALERDGLVEQHAVRRESAGKPAYVYRTTTAAETLFPKPYDRVLAELLTVLEGRYPAAEVEQLVRQVGRRLASGVGAASGDLRARATHAAAVLTELGGLAEVQDDADGLRLQGYSCPLSAVAATHPETCRLAEALVSELMQVPVTECCERSERPKCAFRVFDA
jgi:predicted ArsR family transcriptional regulator